MGIGTSSLNKEFISKVNEYSKTTNLLLYSSEFNQLLNKIRSEKSSIKPITQTSDVLFFTNPTFLKTPKYLISSLAKKEVHNIPYKNTLSEKELSDIRDYYDIIQYCVILCAMIIQPEIKTGKDEEKESNIIKYANIISKDKRVSLKSDKTKTKEVDLIKYITNRSNQLISRIVDDSVSYNSSNLLLGMSHTNHFSTLDKLQNLLIEKKESKLSLEEPVTLQTDNTSVLLRKILTHINTNTLCGKSGNTLQRLLISRNVYPDLVSKVLNDLIKKIETKNQTPIVKKIINLAKGRLSLSRDSDDGLVIETLFTKQKERLRDIVNEVCIPMESYKIMPMKDLVIHTSGEKTGEFTKEKRGSPVYNLYNSVSNINTILTKSAIRTFDRIFEKSDILIPETINIPIEESYLLVRPDILNSKDPGKMLINIAADFIYEIMNTYDSLSKVLKQTNIRKIYNV